MSLEKLSDHYGTYIDEWMNLKKKQKKPFLLWDMIRSLLIGFFAVGPAIIVVMVLWQLVMNWAGL
ncbi:hypothetical protein [Priestia koreensis]|uniref:hypothetical protein n=1 Tax=Priestia koreensis TaxID=284581 RepID=UPI001F5937CC|nr:hypothetical protein [Priestia koreensis]UNL86634.1 hypothetical protein IE339_09150 [Priestia koreensis]